MPKEPHALRRSGDPRTDSTSLGNIIIQLGLASAQQVAAAAEAQEGMRERDRIEWLIGQILVRSGVLSPADLVIALIKQSELRRRSIDYVGARRMIAQTMTDQMRQAGRSLDELKQAVTETVGLALKKRAVGSRSKG